MRLALLSPAVLAVLAQTPGGWRAQATALKAKGDAAGALAAFERAAGNICAANPSNWS